jgi:smad nuclear-interacting protein 1
MSSGNHQSRWKSNNNNAASQPQPPSSQAVSDEDALKALMSSAQAREQERSESLNKNKRQYTDKNKHPYDKKPRQGDDRDSYYGPEGGGRGGRGNNNDHGGRNGGGGGGRGGGRGGDRDRDRRPRNDHYGPRKIEGEEEAPPNEEDEAPKPPEVKPNFGLSGALTKDAGGGGNVYKGIVLKFQEPPEARAPNTQWRFYVFKGKDMVETLHVSKQSAYLLGRNKDICDICVMHPSLSSQHAVLQYRALPLKNDPLRVSCQPYILDLESTNGTFLNDVRIDPARYYQLKKGDLVKFGASTREYVLMTENTTSVK